MTTSLFLSQSTPVCTHSLHFTSLFTQYARTYSLRVISHQSLVYSHSLILTHSLTLTHTHADDIDEIQSVVQREVAALQLIDSDRDSYDSGVLSSVSAGYSGPSGPSGTIFLDQNQDDQQDYQQDGRSQGRSQDRSQSCIMKLNGIREAMLRQHLSNMNNSSYWLFWILDTYKLWKLREATDRHTKSSHSASASVEALKESSADWVDRNCHTLTSGRAELLNELLSSKPVACAHISRVFRNHFDLNRSICLNLRP